jgi:hypothetical protein
LNSGKIITFPWPVVDLFVLVSSFLVSLLVVPLVVPLLLVLLLRR